MRLRERDKQNVRVYTPLGLSDDVYTWTSSFMRIRAAVYPGGRNLDPKVYGDRITEMRLMLYEGEETLEAGMGISFDDGLPAFRIASVEKWDHQRIVLERIPPGRRG